jgi:hypothetical protein
MPDTQLSKTIKAISFHTGYDFAESLAVDERTREARIKAGRSRKTTAKKRQ